MIKLKPIVPLCSLRKAILFQILFAGILFAHTAHAQQAGFTADNTSGCSPLTVRFTSTGSGNTHWSWKFGNGNTSIGSTAVNQNPAAVYINPGTYTVELTATGPGGPDTQTKTAYITVYAKPTVDFSFDKNTGCSPLTVKFTDLSTAGSGNITQWRWLFGDGHQSGDKNPAHVYESSGAKTLNLVVTNQYGCEGSGGKPSAIQVLGPTADFTVSNNVFCQVPAMVEFNDNASTGEQPLTYDWDFKDGTGTVRGTDPSHEYLREGLFNPVLTVTDKNGCKSKKTGEIRTGGEGGLTVTPSKAKICIGEEISFNITSDAPITSYNWNFGNNTSSSADEPTVSYPTGGKTYTVSLRAQLVGKSCESTVTFPVEVLAKPVPKFNYTSNCDYRVTFTNTSTGASRVQWLLENGFTTALNSFSRTYPGPGSYAVKLIAYNALDCPVVLEQLITVAAKPTASFTPNKDQDCVEPSLSGCAPFTVSFVNTSSSSSSFSSKWTFGDNSTDITTKNATHTYAAGNYTVSLEIKNSQGCSNKVSAKVTVSDKTPIAKFIVSKTVACAKEPIFFTDQSTDATFWCWNFGDGQKATGQNPQHAYEEPGVYTVTLTAKNAGCTSTFTITDAVTIKDPFVDFKYTKGCGNPYEIVLNNMSLNCDEVKWDFGDGGTSTVKNPPPHPYTATGTYVVKLVGKNLATQCEVKSEKTVNIYDIKALFKVDVVKPCKGAPVTFTDESKSASSWSWDFGDGKPADARQSPTNTYDTWGHYEATLTASDPDGCANSKTVAIDVLDINGDFSFIGSSNCTNLTADFTDLSIANPPVDDWLWDFGDGVTSDEQNPTHIYTYDPIAGPKNYPITVTLTNGEGTCSFVKYDAVKFTIPTVDFKVDKPGNCMNVPIQFTNMSYNAQSFAWDFGDGEQTSTDTHPRISYEGTGEYTVSLSATDQYGCKKTQSKPKFIAITKPVADFVVHDTYTKCPDPSLTPTFEDKSLGNIAAWYWDSGDGQQAAFTDPSIDPSFPYFRPGEFDVTLIVKDVNGCSDTTVAKKAIFVGGPWGTFQLATPGPYCLNDSVVFTAQTINAVNHRWDFADGLVKDQPEMNAGHRYRQTGGFFVSLTLTDAQQPEPCTISLTERLQLEVLDTAKIDFKFPSCVFTGEESSFEVDLPEDDLTYSWVVDGQEAGTGNALPATLNTPGKHSVVLTAISQQGCRSEMQYEVPVQGDVLFVPNVFTPNGDGLNNEFQVLGVERSTWDLKVFNRWGEPVYQQKDYKNTWTAPGISAGVYYYLLQNAICPGREYKGIVSVIR